MLTRQRRISNIWSTIETSHTLPADPVVHCIHFALQLQFPQVETNWLLCQGKLTLLTAIYSVQCAHCSTTWCTLHSPLYIARYIALQPKMHCRVQTDCCIVHYFLDSAVQRGPELPLLLGSRWTIAHPHILVAFHGQHFSTLRSHMDGRIPRFIRLLLKHH